MPPSTTWSATSAPRWHRRSTAARARSSATSSPRRWGYKRQRDPGACARGTPATGLLLGRCRLVPHARERLQSRLGLVAANLSDVGNLVEASDLSLPLYPCRMAGRQVADQSPDSLAQLQREVRSRGAHQLAHVIDRDLAPRPKAIRVLRLTHLAGPWDVPLTGCGSRSASTFAWTPTEIAFASPINQPWL